MVPSNKWFSMSLQERAAWFQNFAAQFNSIAGMLGFLPATVTAVNLDRDDMVFCAQSAIEVDAYAKAVRKYRRLLTEGDVGSPATAFPTNPTLAPPAQVATGIFERLDNLVKRIRLAPAYNDEIGAALGILPVPPNGFAPDTMQPSLKASTLPGSVVQIKFVRGSTDGVVIETKLDNADTWSNAGKFFKSPAELVIPVNALNLPRSVQVRARYVEGDTPVGQFSDVVTTATQPAG